jgi:hypothetical protein
VKVAFDIDGTLADCTHRRHYVEGAPGSRNWKAFYDACGEDPPLPVAVEVLRALVAAGHEIALFTGRPERVRRVTETWLAIQLIPALPLYMRKDGDSRKDHVIKPEFLAHFRPDLIFDDRQSVVDMWRSLGIPCFQVARGDF